MTEKNERCKIKLYLHIAEILLLFLLLLLFILHWCVFNILHYHLKNTLQQAIKNLLITRITVDDI